MKNKALDNLNDLIEKSQEQSTIEETLDNIIHTASSCIDGPLPANDKFVFQSLLQLALITKRLHEKITED